MAAVDEDRAAEDLGDLSSRLGAEPVRRVEAVLGRLGADLHLHELVRRERVVELAQDRIADPLLPDLHDRSEVVTGRAQRLRSRVEGMRARFFGFVGAGMSFTF